MESFDQQFAICLELASLKIAALHMYMFLGPFPQLITGGWSVEKRLERVESSCRAFAHISPHPNALSFQSIAQRKLQSSAIPKTLSLAFLPERICGGPRTSWIHRKLAAIEFLRPRPMWALFSRFPALKPRPKSQAGIGRRDRPNAAHNRPRRFQKASISSDCSTDTKESAILATLFLSLSSLNARYQVLDTSGREGNTSLILIDPSLKTEQRSVAIPFACGCVKSHSPRRPHLDSRLPSKALRSVFSSECSFAKCFSALMET